MKRTLAYNRYPLVICTLGLLLGGLHSLFQLHQTPADTWTAAYLTAREGTELMLTENSTIPKCCAVCCICSSACPCWAGCSAGNTK